MALWYFKKFLTKQKKWNPLLHQRNYYQYGIFDQEWYLLDMQNRFVMMFHCIVHLSTMYSAIKFSHLNQFQLIEIENFKITKKKFLTYVDISDWFINFTKTCTKLWKNKCLISSIIPYSNIIGDRIKQLKLNIRNIKIKIQ